MDLSLDQACLYAEQMSSAQEELLQEIFAYTSTHHAEPHMVSGPLQGLFLTMISKMIQPKRILEIGTLSGYSAICLAKGLKEDGILHTIEIREEDAQVAQSFISKSAWSKQIKVHTGNAHEIIDQLNEDWDLVFVDADKTGYETYYEKLITLLRSGSWMLFDNVFFHGQALEQDPKGKNAKAIAQFNKRIAQDERIEKLMIPLRDGLTLIRKK